MNALLVLVAIASSPAEEAASAQARASLKPFKVALKQALTDALAESPMKAVTVCAEQAPALARQSSTATVTVGRAAVKLRNPKNAAPSWLKEPMAALARARAGTDASRVVALGGGRYGYAEAIWIQPMCLTCHGEAVAEPIRAAIQASYPSDAATGFKDGEFRGVWWAEVSPK